MHWEGPSQRSTNQESDNGLEKLDLVDLGTIGVMKIHLKLSSWESIDCPEPIRFGEYWSLPIIISEQRYGRVMQSRVRTDQQMGVPAPISSVDLAS